MDIEKLKYPIGKNQYLGFSAGMKESAIETISVFPTQLKKATDHLIDKQLNAPYRPGGWSIRQVVHHCADSHMNALIRFKLALTEDNPTIRPYAEGEWAKMADYDLNIDISLSMLNAIHHRWSIILKSMKDSDFERTYFHPEAQKTFTLSEALMHYEWHSKHHLAHVRNKIERENW